MTQDHAHIESHQFAILAAVAGLQRPGSQTPDFGAFHPLDALDGEEQGNFVDSRCSRNPIGISCRFPRAVDGSISTGIEMLGTAATRISSLSDVVVARSFRLQIERDRDLPQNSGGSLTWPELVAHPGAAVTAADLAELDAWTVSQELIRANRGRKWDEASLEPWKLVESISEAPFAESPSVDDSEFAVDPDVKFWPQLQNIRPGVLIILRHVSQQCRAGKCQAPMQLDSVRLSRYNYVDSSKGEKVAQERYVFTLDATTIGYPDKIRVDLERQLLSLHLSLDVLVSHLFLLAGLKHICGLFEDDADALLKATLAKSDPARSMRRVELSVARMAQRRMRSLRWFEHAWELDSDRYRDDVLRCSADSTLNVGNDWLKTLKDIRGLEEVSTDLANRSMHGRLRRPLPGANRSQVEMPSIFSTKHKEWWGGISLSNWRELRGVDRNRSESVEGRAGGNERSARLVELHPFSNRDIILGTISTRITTSSLLTATAGVLLGLVLSNPRGLVEAPHAVLLLLISTFAFFFETLMLSQASRSLEFTTMEVAIHSQRATGISLFLGQYPFAVALPMTISRLIGSDNRTNEDLFLSGVVCLLGLLLLIVYFEVIEAGSFAIRSYPRPLGADELARPPGRNHIFPTTSRRLLMVTLHLMTAGLLVGRLVDRAYWWMWIIEIVLIGSLFLMAYMSWLVARFERHYYYEIDSWDEMGVETASFLDFEWRSGKPLGTP